MVPVLVAAVPIARAVPAVVEAPVAFGPLIPFGSLHRALSRSALAGLDLWRLFSTMSKISYAGYRFPPEIIQQTIWLYVRFTLSFRDVEDLLAERGIMVSYSY